MGCDGGTIPTRDELVKTRKKPEQKDKDAERLFQWQHCHLTQEPLVKPIVACELGMLFNKEALIKRMLDKNGGDEDKDTEAARSVEHIKGLKDIKELDLTPNPSYKSKHPSVGDSYVDKLVSPWICPITGLEMNGRFKFVFDWTNGKVLSERAYKMVKDDAASRIEPENMVIMNPVEEDDKELMRSRMKERRAAAKKAKKDLKRKAKEETKETATEPTTKKEEEKSAAKKGKKTEGVAAKKSKEGGAKPTLQKDPTKSEVYKSLFSSHKDAQNRPKGNWVTFDPRYN